MLRHGVSPCSRPASFRRGSSWQWPKTCKCGERSRRQCGRPHPHCRRFAPTFGRFLAIAGRATATNRAASTVRHRGEALIVTSLLPIPEAAAPPPDVRAAHLGRQVLTRLGKAFPTLYRMFRAIDKRQVGTRSRSGAAELARALRHLGGASPSGTTALAGTWGERDARHRGCGSGGRRLGQNRRCHRPDCVPRFGPKLGVGQHRLQLLNLLDVEEWQVGMDRSASLAAALVFSASRAAIRTFMGRPGRARPRSPGSSPRYSAVSRRSAPPGPPWRRRTP